MLAKKIKALEIVEIKGWLNSEPLSLEKLRGKVVLLDFWTYSCVNCLRTLPALKEIWEKYKDKNFMLIGIHTPEFEFEKELENVKNAVKRNSIEYPVANDPERVNWNRYGNRYWPRAALINSNGELIFDHVGESGYDDIDARIIAELKKIGEVKDTEGIKEQKRAHHFGVSPEIYAGSLRNEGIGSSQVCTPDGCDVYKDQGDYKMNVIYLEGEWVQKPEFVEFVKGKGYIIFKFYASEVNVVMDGSGNAVVFLNGKPLTKLNSGSDVKFRGKKSYVGVEGAGMYNIIRKKDFAEGELKIEAFKGMRVYAYTFG
ncbi:redoxin domain-containing protein [Candidatus Pacearchaeota archaeon]|nr:redoxin domain-containing protein [Candidatus Pacearchaeota archaeon]